MNDDKKTCFEQIRKILEKWSNTDVRTVPGVMYQVRCDNDENDQNIEYRIHWFIDCTETYIHNHRCPFDTFCLEGRYLEKLWEIDDDKSDATTFRFRRTLGNIFNLPELVPGALSHVQSRHHFPGNQMHVDTHQFHSITPIHDCSSRVLTFISRQKCISELVDTFVLSSSPEINGPNDETRPATEEERQAMYEKLQQVFTTSLYRY